MQAYGEEELEYHYEVVNVIPTYQVSPSMGSINQFQETKGVPSWEL